MEWISVKEGLPSVKDYGREFNVFIYTPPSKPHALFGITPERKCVTTLRWSYKLKWKSSDDVSETHAKKWGFFRSGDSEAQLDEVTHWAPLPEEPELGDLKTPSKRS